MAKAGVQSPELLGVARPETVRPYPDSNMWTAASCCFGQDYLMFYFRFRFTCSSSGSAVHVEQSHSKLGKPLGDPCSRNLSHSEQLRL